jgi:hypothetical protein
MKSLLLCLAVVSFAGCVSNPETRAVHVIGGQHPAPIGCRELGPVQLSGSSLLNTSLVGNPNDEMLREMTLAKGGDTLHYTSAFPPGRRRLQVLQGVRYDELTPMLLNEVQQQGCGNSRLEEVGG